MNRRLKELEERIGYGFENKDLLFDAMTHSSYANEHRIQKRRCNERLEFWGTRCWRWCPATTFTTNTRICRRGS